MVPTDLWHRQLLVQTHGHMKHEEYGCTEYEDKNHHLRREHTTEFSWAIFTPAPVFDEQILLISSAPKWPPPTSPPPSLGVLNTVNYHKNPDEAVEQRRGVVVPHDGQQQAFIWLFRTLLVRLNATQQLAAVAVLAPGVQGEQRHKGRHLEDKVHEHSQGCVQRKCLDCWHGG